MIPSRSFLWWHVDSLRYAGGAVIAIHLPAQVPSELTGHVVDCRYNHPAPGEAGYLPPMRVITK